jgi:hypothetical protein
MNGKYTKFQTWPPSTISRLYEKIGSKNPKIYIYFAESLLKLSSKSLFAESLGWGSRQIK